MPPEANLLDWLQDACGCAYLSDLRQPELAPAILAALAPLSPGSFSAAQWQDAAHYLLGAPVQASGLADARACLLQALEAGFPAPSP